jgi:pimeloyl-ACP methyl ester carboxylesterase
VIQYPLGTAGTQTRVLEAGSGDRTMLLVHGVGARADRWRLNIDPFADAGYHAFAVDLPGHGFASKGDGFSHSVPNYAAFARGVLEEVGADRWYLVGTSLGGHVLATVACEAPERVAGLVLVGTLGMVPLGTEARERTAGLIADASPETVDRKLRTVLHDEALVTADLLREEVRINNSPGAAEAFAQIAEYFARHIDDHVVGEQLAAVCGDVPVLLVWGREDLGFPPAMGEAAHDLLPGSRLAIMDNAAHAPYFERPEAFNAIVTGFFAGHLGSEPIDGVEVRG